jgi:hypothetical protein
MWFTGRTRTETAFRTQPTPSPWSSAEPKRNIPIEFERKVFVAGGSLRVNLPAPITKALNIKDGFESFIRVHAKIHCE